MAVGTHWNRFEQLVAKPAKKLVEVVTDHGDDTVTVTDPSGAQWRVAGSGTAGSLVWVQSEQVVGDGPALTLIADQEV